VAYCNLFCDRAGSGEFPRALRQKGLPYFHVPGRRWRDLPRMIAGLVRLFRREHFDIVHTHMLQGTLIGQAAARLARIPIRLVTRHYTDEALRGRPVVRRIERRAMRRATRVIAVSDAVRDGLVRGGVPEEKVQVILNGIDLSLFDRAALEEPLPWPESWNRRLLIGSVGGLFPEKGHAHLLRAMVAVIRSEPNARLVIGGDGPERASLEKLAVELGIGRCVAFSGFRRDVMAVLPHLDLYVQPSLNESFGISILEAMAAGKAVVATKTGGVPEVVVHGETGILAPPRDVSALSRSILELASTPELARRMGDNGRRRVEQQFDVHRTVQACEALYDECAGN
jgi:glycosyltransferase involved in cell wall biosynthesis